MINKNFKNIFEEVLNHIEPPTKDLAVINDFVNNFLEKIKYQIKIKKIDAEVFVGGSFAKGTLMKKEEYDVDVFIRFDKSYPEEEISPLTASLLKGIFNFKVVHGSRDYFKIHANRNFFIEVVPVIRIRKPEESLNITDLSFSHVKYLSKKIKSKQMLDEIKLAKAFCNANGCYGAESYIRGFSGYGLELLVYYYGGFLKFLREITKIKNKLIIDIEKMYKNKQQILMDLNASKLDSPIVLIDPTYKQRNALSALSYECFKKFQKASSDFLKKPSVEFFKSKKIDLQKIRENAKKKNLEFILIKVNTSRQEGDIAGSKLLKFYNHLSFEIERWFNIYNKGFAYGGGKHANLFFVVKRKENVLLEGPSPKDISHAEKFKQAHKNFFIKKGKLFSKEKINLGISEFIKKWIIKNKVKLKEMSINNLQVI